MKKIVSLIILFFVLSMNCLLAINIDQALGKPFYTPDSAMGFYVWVSIEKRLQIHWIPDRFAHTFSGTVEAEKQILNFFFSEGSASDVIKRISKNKISFSHKSESGISGIVIVPLGKWLKINLQIDGNNANVKNIVIGKDEKNPESNPFIIETQQ